MLHVCHKLTDLAISGHTIVGCIHKCTVIGSLWHLTLVFEHLGSRGAIVIALGCLSAARYRRHGFNSRQDHLTNTVFSHTVIGNV